MTDQEKQHSNSEEFETYETKSKNKKTLTFSLLPILGVLGIIALMAGCFWAGIEHQKQQDKNTMPMTRMGGGFGTQDQAGRRMGEIGTVTAVSSDSITVMNSRTDSSKTYQLTSTTTITKDGQTIESSSISIGDTVLVQLDSANISTVSRIIVDPSFGQPPTTQDNQQTP